MVHVDTHTVLQTSIVPCFYISSYVQKLSGQKGLFLVNVYLILDFSRWLCKAKEQAQQTLLPTSCFLPSADCKWAENTENSTVAYLVSNQAAVSPASPCRSTKARKQPVSSKVFPACSVDPAIDPESILWLESC